MSIQGMSRMRSVMDHRFSEVPDVQMERSMFRRDHGYKTAFDGGLLVPIYVDEALPGDTHVVSLASVARLATPLVPFMDNLHMDFFFFAVPNRLLWANWQKFMGEQEDPGDSTDFVVPQVTAPSGGWTVGSLADYFGVPILVDPLPVNALHFRAYNLIWNEWFRDQNLSDSLEVHTGDGPDPDTDYVVRRRCKRHDYFTSCLPWPQKGDEIDLPLGVSAPVVGTGLSLGLTDGTSNGGLFLYGHGVEQEVLSMSGDHLNKAVGWSGSATGSYGEDYALGVVDSAYSGLEADLSNATAATINSLREAFQLQRLLERDARGGTRYTEIIKSHFRVDSPDARLQRPEYLGGGSSKVSVTAVPQTSESGTTEQGHLTAVGYHSQAGVGFSKSFVEHSVIIGMVNVRADLTYQQGLHRMWSRQTKYDFYWPALAHLGEQEVLNKEIFSQGIAADDNVFGYQERWAEMRYKPSQITGVLRSDAPSSLDVWHLSQDFGALPVLNDSFIGDNPPISRVVAVPAEPEFVFDGFFSVKCTRPMPTYSVPGLIDHF